MSSKSRSVNDYDSSEALREALRSMEQRPTSVCRNSLGDDYRPQVRKAADVAVIDAIGSELFLRGDRGAAATKLNDDEKENEKSMKLDMETELRRLAVLKSYRVVGSGRNVAYERLVSLTSRIFKAPIAHISVIDLENQYLLAARGMGGMAEQQKGDRKTSICAQAIVDDRDLMVIPDLTQDSSFHNHDHVIGLPHLRFYASAPLVCPEGYRLGTLCVMDTVPRPEGLSLDMKQNLREIADMVVDIMVEERERMNFEYRQPSQLIASTANDLIPPLTGMVGGLSAMRSDEALFNSLSSHQREIFNTAYACASVMNRICKKSLESFNKMRKKKNKKSAKSKGENDDENGDDEENHVDIRELVKQLHVVMDPFPKRVPIVVTTADDVPKVIVLDDLKVFRSLVNYLTNACAHTDNGSVHLKIFLKDEELDGDDEASNANERNVNASSGTHTQRIVFLVEDTGSGISVDQYKNLFKPIVAETEQMDASCALASYAEASTTTQTKTSLGLYSVATQISSIGGTYGFRPRGFSECGSQLLDSNGNELKGSVFWFSVPLVVPPSGPDVSTAGAAIVVEEEEEAASLADAKSRLDMTTWSSDYEAALMDNSPSTTVDTGTRMRPCNLHVESGSVERRKRALLIEDSLVVRRTMTRMLIKLGFDVVECVNGMEGLKELQANLYDLVLCDFLMPVMDGMDCVNQYRQFEVAHRPWFEQYILGMSAHANESDVERGMKAGMNDYRAKPISMKQLEEIIQRPEYQYLTSRLDVIADEMGEESNDVCSKRPRTELTDDPSACQNEQIMKVCLIVEEGNSISCIAQKVAEENGWKSVVVHTGEAALRLLQMRNWDAVLLDDELPGLTSCMVMEHFREWEKKNRVNRQKNVFQVNSSFIPFVLGTSTSVQLPFGFDGALGKPLSSKIFQDFLDKSVKANSCTSQDIVSR